MDALQAQMRSVEVADDLSDVPPEMRYIFEHHQKK
jgi:hypothetical protein